MACFLEQVLACLSELLHAIAEPDQLEVRPCISDDGGGQRQPGERDHKELAMALAIELAHELLVSHFLAHAKFAPTHETLMSARSLALLARGLSAIASASGTTGFLVSTS